MIKRMNDFLAGLPMTIVGGVFLVMSFAFSRTGIVLPIDAAWVTVNICGIPLLYLAVWRVIYNEGISKISFALLISVAMIAAIVIGDLFAADETLENDILRVLPGETIPVDGMIVHGETSIDQSIMTGESLPVDKGIGETVFCGTVNAIMAAIGQATKHGVIIKSGEALEKMGKASVQKYPVGNCISEMKNILCKAA